MAVGGNKLRAVLMLVAGDTRLHSPRHGHPLLYGARPVPDAGRAAARPDQGAAAQVSQVAGRRLRRASCRIARQAQGPCSTNVQESGPAQADGGFQSPAFISAMGQGIAFWPLILLLTPHGRYLDGKQLTMGG